MIIRQTLQYLPAQFVGPLSQFVAVLIWTHWLLPKDYGLVALLFSVQELVFALCMSWWTQYTVRYLPGLTDRGPYERSENAAILMASLAEVPVVLAALALMGHLDSGPLVAAALAFTLTRTVCTHLGERARALGDVITYTVVQFMGPVLGLGVGFILFSVRPDAVAVLAGFAVVQAAILPVLAWRLGLRPRLSLRIDPLLLRAATGYGLPLLAAGGFGWVSVNGIRIVVERLDGLAAVGLLSVGWNLGQRLIGVVATLVTAAAFPLAVRQVASDGVGAGIAQIGRTSILIFALLLPSAVGLCCISARLTETFVGLEFQAVTLLVLPLASLAAAIRNLRMHTVDQVFMLAERPRFLLALNAAEACAAMVLCVAGFAWYGLPGACLGILAAAAASTVYAFGVGRLQHNFHIPVWSVLGLCAAAAAMAAVLLLDIYPTGTFGLMAQIAVGGTVYAGLAALILRPFFFPRNVKLYPSSP